MKNAPLPAVIALQLLAVLTCAALCHYGLKYFTVCSRESMLSDPAVQAAPRMLVRGAISRGTVSVRTDPVAFLEDSPLLGKSLWWSAEWQQFVTECAREGKVRIMNEDGRYMEYDVRVPSAEAMEPLALRPHPGSTVTGARRIPVKGEVPVAVFWQQGADSVWSICRVEAAGSSEDRARDGEKRIPGKIKTFQYEMDVIGKRHGDRFIPLPSICLYLSPKEPLDDYPDISYRTGAEERMALKGCTHKNVIMELALPKNHPIVPTEVYINGHPFADAIEYLRNNSYPPEKPFPAPTTP